MRWIWKLKIIKVTYFTKNVLRSEVRLLIICLVLLMEYCDKDKYVEMLYEVVFKVCRNLAKPRREFCPCRFDMAIHTPSDVVCCGHADFHAPELLFGVEFAYAVGCLNQFMEKHPEYAKDEFFMKTAEFIAKDKVSALHAMQEVKVMLYKHISQQ